MLECRNCRPEGEYIEQQEHAQEKEANVGKIGQVPLRISNSELPTLFLLTL